MRDSREYKNEDRVHHRCLASLPDDVVECDGNAGHLCSGMGLLRLMSLSSVFLGPRGGLSETA